MDPKYLIGFSVGCLFAVLIISMIENFAIKPNPEPAKSTYIELRNESKRMDAYFYDIFHYEVPVGFILLPFRADTVIIVSHNDFHHN